MPQKMKNGNIMSFLKKPASQPGRQESSQPSARRPPSPPPPSSPMSQATTPRKKAHLARDHVVLDSEDEGDGDDSSSDGLEDLTTLLGRGRPSERPAPSRPAQDPYATPRAKRTALEFHASPLTIMTKPKFDLKALAKAAQEDKAVNESSMRVKAAVLEGDDEAVTTGRPSGLELLDGDAKDRVRDAQKVQRAVQRTEGQSLPRFCFFKEDYEPPASRIPSKVRAFKDTPWRILIEGDTATREQNLISGLPLTLTRHLAMPNELFSWLLDEICVSKSIPIMRELVIMVLHSESDLDDSGPFSHVMTPQRLDELFLLLGATEGIKDWHGKLHISRYTEEPYQGRDWKNLECFLVALGAMAYRREMPDVTVFHATQLLLRMSMDRFLFRHAEVLSTFTKTIRTLLDAVPPEDWEVFCAGTCELQHTTTQAQCVRINALCALPATHRKAHELRRRLATAFLFDDHKLGQVHPDEVITIRGMIQRLDHDDFSVHPKTDFAELRACVLLLDMAIDDGSFVATQDPEDEKNFNADIDELATRLREIWRKINDSGMKLARTETKSVIESVQQRVAHSVRTKRKPRRDVFGLPGQTGEPDLRRQQELMARIFKARDRGEGGANSGVVRGAQAGLHSPNIGRAENSGGRGSDESSDSGSQDSDDGYAGSIMGGGGRGCPNG